MQSMDRKDDSNLARVGRWLALAIAGLVTLNGVGWFFYGPTLATFEQDTGIQLAAFRAAYPEAARLISLQARNTGVLLVGIGLMGLVSITLPNRTDPGRSGLARWVFGLTLVGVGASELLAGASFGFAYLGLGIVSLLGQGLARRGGPRPSD